VSGLPLGALGELRISRKPSLVTSTACGN
jgi:hypothetical protein